MLTVVHTLCILEGVEVVMRAGRECLERLNRLIELSHRRLAKLQTQRAWQRHGKLVVRLEQQEKSQ